MSKAGASTVNQRLLVALFNDGVNGMEHVFNLLILRQGKNYVKFAMECDKHHIEKMGGKSSKKLNNDENTSEQYVNNILTEGT